MRAFAEALEIVPYTLAENAGLHAIAVVTDLRFFLFFFFFFFFFILFFFLFPYPFPSTKRNKHASGETSAGINAKSGQITDMKEENVLQPLLVTSNALHMATETVVMLLKIDDLVYTR